MEKMPEYPEVIFKGYSEDKKRLVYQVGKSVREIDKHDEVAFDHFKYALLRLNRLIKHKRERMAMDSIM